MTKLLPFSVVVLVVMFAGLGSAEVSLGGSPSVEPIVGFVLSDISLQVSAWSTGANVDGNSVTNAGQVKVENWGHEPQPGASSSGGVQMLIGPDVIVYADFEPGEADGWVVGGSWNPGASGRSSITRATFSGSYAVHLLGLSGFVDGMYVEELAPDWLRVFSDTLNGNDQMPHGTPTSEEFDAVGGNMDPQWESIGFVMWLGGTGLWSGSNELPPLGVPTAHTVWGTGTLPPALPSASNAATVAAYAHVTLSVE